jgi:hypothetical protein
MKHQWCHSHVERRISRKGQRLGEIVLVERGLVTKALPGLFYHLGT